MQIPLAMVGSNLRGIAVRQTAARVSQMEGSGLVGGGFDASARGPSELSRKQRWKLGPVRSPASYENARQRGSASHSISHALGSLYCRGDGKKPGMPKAMALSTIEMEE